MPIQSSLLRSFLLLALVLLAWGTFLPAVASAQGIYLQASGAINRGMGGATTGTAVDAIGSMYWNPATISQLPTDELAFGFESIYVNYNLSSTLPGAGSGSSDGEIGVTPVPTISWVHQTNNPYLTFGLGVSGVAGFSTNFRADPNNPILGPPLGTGGTGVGGMKSEAMFFQIAPAWSVRMTDRLSIAAGPAIGLAKITFDDNAFVGVNANNLYPRGDGSRYHWGLGAQLGVHYIHDCCWEFGASFKTPTWYEKFRYFSEDAAGLPRTDQLDID
ncbi:MAG: outer membrane protein transport protein, partial [Planctomycetota bacterium]